MKIAYICNCERFCSTSIGCIANGGECSHTCDINFAKNYKDVPIVTEDDNFVNISNDYNEAYYYEEGKDGRD